MCDASAKYQSLIDQLVKNTYPSMHQSLNSISANETALPSLTVKNHVRDFQKEFRSLESFEKKLIFPSVLSIFMADEYKKTAIPDIDAIINLTAVREDRLRSSMNEISQIIKLNEIDNSKRNEQNEITKLFELDFIFYNDFLPSKKLWREYLFFLPNISDSCLDKINGECLCAMRITRENISD